MIIADTSALLALFNRREPAHAAVADVITTRRERLVVSPCVVAELDYLVATRLGVDAELAVLAELSGGAYDLASFGADQVARCSTVIAKYRDLDIGIADASVIVLADERRTRTVLTLDRRHFTVVRPLDGGRFTILP